MDAQEKTSTVHGADLASTGNEPSNCQFIKPIDHTFKGHRRARDSDGGVGVQQITIKHGA